MKLGAKVIIITSCVITLFCYIAVLVPPTLFWPASIMAYGVLPLFFINIIIIIIRKKLITILLKDNSTIFK